MELKSLRSRRLCVLCVFVGLIRHTQQIRGLSVFNGAKENAEDAERRAERRELVFLSASCLSFSEDAEDAELRRESPNLTDSFMKIGFISGFLWYKYAPFQLKRTSPFRLDCL